MQTGSLAAVPMFVVVAIAFAAWLVAAWSMLGILRHARGGRWFKLMFQFGWWNPATVDRYIEPGGLPHHRRLIKAMAVFFVAVFCGMAYVFARIALQGYK